MCGRGRSTDVCEVWTCVEVVAVHAVLPRGQWLTVPMTLRGAPPLHSCFGALAAVLPAVQAVSVRRPPTHMTTTMCISVTVVNAMCLPNVLYAWTYVVPPPSF